MAIENKNNNAYNNQVSIVGQFDEKHNTSLNISATNYA